MRSSVLVVAVVSVLLALLGGEGEAQVGRIGVYADVNGTDCELIDAGPGIIEVHIILDQITLASAIQFGAPIPSCWTGATWLADVPSLLLYSGSTQDPIGLSVLLTALPDTNLCPGVDGPIHVAKMLISVTGNDVLCCPYPITKAPLDNYPEIPGPLVIRECDGTTLQEMGRSVAYVNPDPSCDCMLTVPVQQRTWGGVKALYK